MSPIHKPYATMAGLEGKEDGQEMEASPTNSNKDTLAEDQDTTQGNQQSDLASLWGTPGFSQQRNNQFWWQWFLMMPPSFSHPISEETLQDERCPFVQWAMLKFNIPPNSNNAEDIVYNWLADFIKQAGLEDKHFMVFLYNLSKYWHVEDLPPAIDGIENLLEEADEWIAYFPQAKPRFHGGDIYTAVLICLSIPFPKYIKKFSGWCKEKECGLWLATVQTEKPVSIGWLLFSTFSMDVVVLKISIMDTLNRIPVGLYWKMISLGIQGPVKPEDQVKVLHDFVDEMDAAITKPRLMEVYSSWPKEDHNFLLKIWMRLVLEMDLVLNTKGCKNIDKLCACQNKEFVKT